jgi:uncharacterized membrane-anchored protein YhcB (DUF1043 family)
MSTNQLKKIYKDYIEELNELEKQVSIDSDLVYDLAKAYQNNYPHIKNLYSYLIKSIQKDIY